MRLIPIAIAALALGACAQRVPLEPAPGAALPPAPLGARTAPNAETLLTPPPQAAPARSVELRSRSEERADDPFDLPPE